jgi:hypothetical protein
VTDLVFSDARLIGSPTPLVFGATDFVIPSVAVDIAVTLGGVAVAATLVKPVEVNAAISLGGVQVSALVRAPVAVTATIQLGGVTASAAVFYDNRVTPYLDNRALATHQPAVGTVTTSGTTWSITEAKRGGREAPWDKATGRADEAGVAHETSVPKRGGVIAPWDIAIKKAQASSAAHQQGVFKADGRAAGHQAGDDRRVDTDSRMQAGIFKLRPETTGWQPAISRLHTHKGRSGASLQFSGRLASALYQLAGYMPPGASVIVPPVVVPPTFWWGSDLLFEFGPTDANLVFGYTGEVPLALAPLSILAARFYMTTHSIYAQRLPDLADIPLFEATVSADIGSYCWTLSATGPASLFAQLAPVDGLPVQLKVVLDGIPFVFAVDAMSRSRSFGKSGVSVSGRSVTALIGAPYMRAITRNNAGGSEMAQQLALAALQYSGVDLDWGVTSGALANGGLADWLIPAGAWSHQGTPLDAVQAIAQAAGGYLQSHRSAATLLARHAYGQRAGDNSGAPWSWMTGPADVELAPDAIITDGTERKDGADINAVYVSGTTQGVLAQVKRSGTAGDKLAAMVTDALITHTDAARQRGLAVLGAAGAKYNVRLELPVLTGAGQPGVLDVGQLVQINAAQPWRGRVRSVSVNAKPPSLRQTVTLERHLEIA